MRWVLVEEYGEDLARRGVIAKGFGKCEVGFGRGVRWE